jgi:hypothetical protein
LLGGLVVHFLMVPKVLLMNAAEHDESRPAQGDLLQ